MFGSRNDQHEFKPLLIEIEEAPLNPLGRTIFWVIIAALMFSALWLVFGKVDVVITARGRVIPAGEVKTIQPLTTGVVRKILVKTGQLVDKGEVLMEIDPSDTEPELASMKADLKQDQLEILRLGALLNGQPFVPGAKYYDPGQLLVQQRLYRSHRAKLERQIQVKREELAATEQQLSSARQACEQAAYLFKVGKERLARLEPVRDLVSRDDYQKARTEVSTDHNQLMTAQHKVDELLATLSRIREQIRLVKEQDRNDLLTQLAKKQQDYLYLKAKVERTGFVNTRQQIRSPVRGYVSQLQVHTVGGVVTPAEKLATVVPADSLLLVKAQVLNKDVGFLSPGMDVAVKVDTFEFQKYGMLHGELLQVAQDSIEDKRLGQVYEAYIKPLQTTLNVEGVQTPIASGMTVTSEIKVGKRRIIEFFIYPLIKYLDEGISVR
ncbi:MAG TPA: HlyD family type I secretion periplasmic adaptor subunit [Desulfuromonadales bacterium]|nr:HlyD family type I secretion periplasmic adaptor subunit [Desulfuromonadales bacterium]